MQPKQNNGQQSPTSYRQVVTPNQLTLNSERQEDNSPKQNQMINNLMLFEDEMENENTPEPRDLRKPKI